MKQFASWDSQVFCEAHKKYSQWRPGGDVFISNEKENEGRGLGRQ